VKVFALLFGLLLALPLLSAACAPAVPYDQMPGAPGDLYRSANGSRMTADALLRQAQWQESALTATAQAPVIRITETAAALAVQGTQAQNTSVAAAQTQAGAMTATAIWWTPTPNVDSTATFAALNAQNTQIANNLERDRLQLEREQTMNDFNAKVTAYSWVIVVLVLVLILTLVTRRWRYQTAKVDARGNVLPILDIVEGSFTDMDRSPNHRGPMKNDWIIRILAHIVEKKLGAKLLPLPEVTAQRQDAVTYRDQLMDLATRGLPAPSRSEDARKAKVGEMMTQPQTPAAPRVQVIGPDQVRPILLDVVPQIAQDSIEAELYDQKKEEGVV
jgi:hypothetical protein